MREDFSQQLAEWLVTDIENTVKAWDVSRKHQEEKMMEGQRLAMERERKAREEGVEEGKEKEKEEERKVERPEMKEAEMEERAKQKRSEGAMFPPTAAVAASSGAVWGAMGKHGVKEGEAQRAKEHPIC